MSSEIEKEDQRSRKDDNLIDKGNKFGSKKKEFDSQDPQMWEQICRMTEAELFSSNWLQRGIWKHENFEGIDANFESQILGQLLDEVVDQIFREHS